MVIGLYRGLSGVNGICGRLLSTRICSVIWCVMEIDGDVQGLEGLRGLYIMYGATGFTRFPMGALEWRSLLGHTVAV